MLAMASARSSLRRRIPTCRRSVSVFVSPPKTALNSVLQVSQEVQEALHGRTKKPVVALESAIYTHGFPYPDNVALSSHLESIVRTEGGVPATVAIVDGIARVGIEPEALIRLCQSAETTEKLKISRRDLANACGTRFLGSDQGKYMGGTTIAGTMVLAHLAGIKVFATGGLGGVHREGENSLDISADLTELGRTPVAVISSGCKSFLDIGRTLEYLETQGVGVATFADGRSGPVKFPGFWSRDSDSQSPQVVQDARHAAAMIHAQHSMGLNSGLLLANPISVSHEIPFSEISTIISNAVSEANQLGISGAKNTPFILSKIKELTEGKSVKANHALISSNVSVGTAVAKELLMLESDSNGTSGDEPKIYPGGWPDHTLENSGESPASEDTLLKRQQNPDYLSDMATEPTVSHPYAENEAPTENNTRPTTSHLNNMARETAGDPHQSDASGIQSDASMGVDEAPTTQVDIVVVGAVAVDTNCYLKTNDEERFNLPRLKSSNDAAILQTVGGVAHNIALAAQITGKSARLMSVVADDIMGRVVLQEMRQEGLNTTDVMAIKGVPGRPRTSQYVCINDGKQDLFVGMADMSIIEFIQDTEYSHFERRLRELGPKWFVSDGNLYHYKLARLLSHAKDFNTTPGAMGPVLTAFEPTSAFKCVRLLLGLSKLARPLLFPRHLVDLATPNDLELSRLWNKAKELELIGSKEHWAIMNSFNLPQGHGSNMLTVNTSEELVREGIPQQALQLLPIIPTLTVTLGPRGVLLAQILRADDDRLSDPEAAPYIIGRSGNIATKNDGDKARRQVGGVYLRLFKPLMVLDRPQNVNGAGDTFTGVLVSELANGKNIEEAIMTGQAGSILSLQSQQAVSPKLQDLIGKSPDELKLLIEPMRS